MEIWLNWTIHKQVKHTGVTHLMLMLHRQQLLVTVFQKMQVSQSNTTDMNTRNNHASSYLHWASKERSSPLTGLHCAIQRNTIKYFQVWSFHYFYTTYLPWSVRSSEPKASRQRWRDGHLWQLVGSCLIFRWKLSRDFKTTLQKESKRKS